MTRLTRNALAVAACIAIAGAAAAQDSTLPRGRTPAPMSLVERSALRERALDLLVEASRSNDALIRANAIEGLQSAPQRAEPVVRAGLVDTNLGVRFVAAMTIGQLRLRESVPFVRPLLNDPDPRVRAAAIFALSKNGQEVDPTPLASMLENPDSRVRSEAARILGELGNPSAIPMLKSAVARSPGRTETQGAAMQAERLFQLQVAEALVRLGEPGASDSLRAALYPSAREGLESAALAAQILGNLKDEKIARRLVELVEELAPNTQRFADPRRNTYAQPMEVRLAAAKSLAQMGFEDGMYVGEMYMTDTEPAVRAQAAFVFGASSHARMLDPLRTMLEDPSPLVRVSAATGILRVLGRL